MAQIPTAAYCRVSTNNDTQDGSFDVQCAYYKRLIEEDPQMRLVGIYGDQGKSGRNMKERKELNRLITDCEAGKVKLILTKSISRFSRNMVECVNTIRHLTSLGVTVRFEKENISTNSMGGKLMLGILATIAEEESNTISQNMNWSRKAHLERGEPWDVPRYGYVSSGREHKWIPVPHEVEVVRKAFYMAGMCHTIPEIMDELNRMEAEAGSSRVWNRTPLRSMLTSVVYVGDYLSNKQCKIIDETGRSKRVKNKGHVAQVLIEGHHEAIVSRELFDAVQKLIEAGLLSSLKTRFTKKDEKLMEESMEAAAKEELLHLSLTATMTSQTEDATGCTTEDAVVTVIKNATVSTTGAEKP